MIYWEIPMLTYSHLQFEMLVLQESSVDWQYLSSYLSLQLQIQVYWLHAENVAAYNWTKFKDTSHWLTQFCHYGIILTCTQTVYPWEACKPNL